MAKISTYPVDSSVSLADYVIGTDSEDSNITKNYTIGSIFALSSGHLNAICTTRAITSVIGPTPVILNNVYTQKSASKWTSVGKRLTYADSGTPATTNLFVITFIISSEPVFGVSAQTSFFIHKNGVALPDTEQNTSTVDYRSTTIQTIQSATTGDYFEVYLTSNGNFNIIIQNVTATVVAVR